MKKYIFFALLFILLIGASAPSYYFYRKSLDAASQLSAIPPTLQPTPKTDDATIVSQVKKLMDFPEEKPTVGTVSQVEKLASQPFFKKAKNGDKVLVFAAAHTAILYRPSENRIIEVRALIVPTQVPTITAEPGLEGSEAAQLQ